MKATSLHTFPLSRLSSTALAVLGLCAAAQAQTATFNNAGGDFEWNNPANWDLGAVPGPGVSATINAGSFVTNNLPVSVASVGPLTLNGTLALNTTGFVVDAGSAVPLTIASTGLFRPGGSGVVTVQNAGTTSIPGGGQIDNYGTLTFSNTGPINLQNASTAVQELGFHTGSVFTMTNTVGSAGINVGANSSSAGAIVQLFGGTVTLDKLLTIAGGGSRFYVKGGTLNCLGGSRIYDSSNDKDMRIDVSAGVANLGNFSVYRSSSAGGLVVGNGIVNATAIQIGTGNSAAYATINGGVVTNTGLFTVSDTTGAATTGDRRSRFLVRGGTVVSTTPQGIIVGNQANTGAASSSVIGGILDINSGSLTAEGITLVKDNTLINAYGTFNLAGSGTVYLGTVGLVGNAGAGGSGYTISLGGGTLAAKADYAINANTPISGTMTFQAAAADGTPHSITHNGAVTGSGALSKTGAGTLTLNGANTYSGQTLINQGTLALGATGSLNNSLNITIAAGAIYDVSARSGASLVNLQALGGNGAVAGSLTAVSGSALRPGGLATAGTLTFSNNLTATGGASITFDLTSDTTGLTKTNDFLSILGDFNLSGTNTIQINPLESLPQGGTYKLIGYGGNFNGSLLNLAVSGSPGLLTNDTVAKTISYVVLTPVRAATNVAWVGGQSGNVWDTQSSSNWFNLGTGTRDIFVIGDAARFDATGAANPLVTIVGSVAPSSLVVDAANDYTFSGTGSIDGSGGLLKTNAGRLTVNTVNGYSGPTTVASGTLSVASLANGGLPSSIGTASSSSDTLLLNGGTTLEYTGPTASSDRGATLQTNNVTLSVSTPTTTLTDAGVLTGAGALVKTGNGILALSGANTYTGGTVVNGGTLQANNTASPSASFSTGGITNNNGTTLRFGANSITLNNIFTVNGNVVVDINTRSGITMRGAWAGAGTVTFTNQNASGNTVTIGGDGSGGGNMANFTGTMSFGTCSSYFRFNDSSTKNYGSAAATFDLGTGAAALLSRNGGVTIDLGALSGGPTTSLRGRGTGSSGTTTYSVGAKNMATTFAGKITDVSDPVALVKVGTNVLTLTGTNDYTGLTTISAGTLQIGDGVNASGQLGNSAVVNNATLVLNRPDDFTVANNISGTGTLIKLGANNVTYAGANTSSGTLAISNGTVTVAGSLTCPIFLAPGATLAASTLASPLSGFGAVTAYASASSGANIRPGGSGVAGTLTFTNLTEGGSVINSFDLSTDPTGLTRSNDLIHVEGDLYAYGVNTILVSSLNGPLTGGTYKLIEYTGNFYGDVTANFSLSGVSGTLTNDVTARTISLILNPIRPATNLTWVGDGYLNYWDELTSSNWLNGANRDYFVPGDSVRFDNTGAANAYINLNGVLTPRSVIVDATVDYTFLGSGSIDSSATLIKTNSGTLSIQTANDYSGPTILGGGVLEVNTLANGLLPSSIGAASSDPTNLVFNGGVLRFTGSTGSTDRGATLNAAVSTIEVPAYGTLTHNGLLTGPGALGKTGSGTLALGGVNSYTGGTVLSNGVLALTSNTANNNGAGAGALGATNNPVTFHGGTLQLFGYNGSTANNYNTLFNPLVVPAGETGTLGMFSRGPGNSGNGSGLQSSLSGGGTLNLVVNYVRDNLDGDWSAFTGLINVTSKSGSSDDMRINNNYGYAKAAIYLNDGVQMDRVGSGNATVDIGELGGTAGAIVGPTSLSGGNPTYRVGWKNTTNTFAGTITNAGTTSITKVGTGTWILTGANTYSGPTIVSNGVLALRENGSISNSASIAVLAGAVLDASGRYDTTLTLGAQTLQGGGVIRANLVAPSGSTVSPGDSIGTLTFNSAATLNGLVLMELNRANGAVTNDMIVAPSITSATGTLVVTNVGPDLMTGDSFKLFSIPVSGFAVSLPATDSTGTQTYTWANNLAVDGTIKLTSGGLSPVNTTRTNFTSVRSGNTLTFSWPADHTGWQLQSNSVSLTATNMWFPVPNSTGTNQVSIPVGTGNAFFRMVYPPAQ